MSDVKIWIKPVYILPPEIWKAATGEKRLTAEFLDWFFENKRAFLKRAEGIFRGISERKPNDWNDAERLLFSMYLQLSAQKWKNRRERDGAAAESGAAGVFRNAAGACPRPTVFCHGAAVVENQRPAESGRPMVAPTVGEADGTFYGSSRTLTHTMERRRSDGWYRI